MKTFAFREIWKVIKRALTSFGAFFSIYYAKLTNHADLINKAELLDEMDKTIEYLLQQQNIVYNDENSNRIRNEYICDHLEFMLTKRLKIFNSNIQYFKYSKECEEIDHFTANHPHNKIIESLSKTKMN